MPTTVAVELTSAEIFRLFWAHAGENVDEFIREVQDAGGINVYLESHRHYRYLGKRHKGTAVASYYSKWLRSQRPGRRNRGATSR